MRSVLGAATIAAALFVSVRARADEGGLRLTWFAPAGCPSGEEVKAAALKGIDPEAKLGPLGLLEADAHVEQQTPSSWRVWVKTRRGTTVGERQIEAATCAGVADATAVVLALALVPPGSTAAEAAAAPAPAPAPSSPQPAPPASAPSSTEPPVRVEEGSHHLAIGAAIGGELGVMPSAAFGGVAHIAWTPGRFRVEALGRILASQSGSIDGTELGAEFSLVGVGGRACYEVVEVWQIEVSPCAGAGVDFVSAKGFGASPNLEPSRTWANVAVGALARVALTRWFALRARVEGVVPLNRPNFVVEGAGPVHRPSSIGAAANIGAEVLFL